MPNSANSPSSLRVSGIAATEALLLRDLNVSFGMLVYAIRKHPLSDDSVSAFQSVCSVATSDNRRKGLQTSRDMKEVKVRPTVICRIVF